MEFLAAAKVHYGELRLLPPAHLPQKPGCFVALFLRLALIAALGAACTPQGLIDSFLTKRMAILGEHTVPNLGSSTSWLEGSLARQNETPSCSKSIHGRREQLIADGRLVPSGDGFYRFTADTAFDSPSGAGGAVYGGSVNGRRYWKHLVSGQSYDDWRKARLEN